MPDNSSTSSVIVIGASGGLGAALCEQWNNNTAVDQVIAVSRIQEKLNQLADDSNIHCIQCDYSEDSIGKAVEEINRLTNNITRGVYVLVFCIMTTFGRRNESRILTAVHCRKYLLLIAWFHCSG